MNWKPYRYAELSDRYTVTWADAKDRYHAALRGNPHYVAPVGNYPTADAAKAACIEHARKP